VAYWYNVDTGKVETDETKGQGDDLMGPYDTEDEASRALDIARAKTARWDEEDRAWDDDLDD
jgi:hypothetical protein